ncbi:signal peptidase I [Actinoplanes sp. NEAU-A12]|uniref:Signal peptidase I n=1 Tax=Actinoplanes sandaracinus TaxID=3045177 RepID=A0ABT6WLX6_9ACTN|nr:signal peptidase I [Actinoplanes sandaracinus]MDI6100655.1 signal peptidase I [Actinoplanes sandaracinus]
MRAVAYRVLRFAVRGRREQGGPWGEAVLAEFDQTTGTAAALRWAAGGLRVATRERYTRRPTAYRLALAAVALLVAALSGVTVNYVPSSSMEPTLTVASRHLVDKVSFHLTGLDYGDIVIHPLPDHPEQETERRVMAVAGDRVDCRDGRVFRNGAAVEEPYLPSGMATECLSVTVPHGALYTLGDNRDVANDSRFSGFVPEDSVIGRVVLFG